MTPLRPLQWEHGILFGDARTIHLASLFYLLDTLNKGFHQPVIEAAQGGRGGGGARLTALGETLITYYTAIEAACTAATEHQLAALFALTESCSQPEP